MQNDHDLDYGDDFKIDAQVWLQTLLAIAGDKDKKEEVVQKIAQKTGFPSEKVEVIIATTINILLNNTRAN